MSKFCIVGNGYLATALKKKIPDYSWYPTEDTKYLLYFGGVRHMDFEKNVEWHTNFGINEFVAIATYCQNHNIKFIYPSSALVYEKETEFSKLKQIMERMATIYENSLGLRIFPVYGPDSHTVINLWCEAILSDNYPIIWGDGTQQRDFLYIDDFVSQVLESVDKKGIIDIGGGKPVSFNEIVEVINKVLNKNTVSIYIAPPEGYNKVGIFSQNPLPTQISISEGVRTILGL